MTTFLLPRFWLLSLLAGLAITAQAAPTLTNPSFEANTFATSPGYISGNSAITGWVGAPTNRVGLNIAGGQNVMADNGVVPQGTRVAFISRTTQTKAPSAPHWIASGSTDGYSAPVKTRLI